MPGITLQKLEIQIAVRATNIAILATPLLMRAMGRLYIFCTCSVRAKLRNDSTARWGLMDPCGCHIVSRRPYEPQAEKNDRFMSCRTKDCAIDSQRDRYHNFQMIQMTVQSTLSWSLPLMLCTQLRSRGEREAQLQLLRSPRMCPPSLGPWSPRSPAAAAATSAACWCQLAMRP